MKYDEKLFFLTQRFETLKAQGISEEAAAILASFAELVTFLGRANYQQNQNLTSILSALAEKNEKRGSDNE